MVDSSQTAALVTDALSMAIANREPQCGEIIHSAHGAQFTFWAFTNLVKRSGLVPSMGSIGDFCDNAIIESFWGRMKSNCSTGNAGSHLLARFSTAWGLSTTADAAILLSACTPTEFELLHHSAQHVV
ncbi:DDE-type integrase/transposase/recombinase [Mycobacterium frederiksbergense]|nr:DDE-type integrase/transposase/recombinase [Mycolicibacterium frederiksbergense]